MTPLNAQPLVVVRSGTREDYDAYLYLGPKDEHHVACIPGDAPGGRDAWAALFRAAPILAQELRRDAGTADDGSGMCWCPRGVLAMSLAMSAPHSGRCVTRRALLRDAGVLK